MQCERCGLGPGSKFIDDPDHFHSCRMLTRTLTLQRHNNIMQVLMDLGRAAGYTVTREPNDHVRPIEQSMPSAKNYNSHADILMMKHDQSIYIDVSITRPTSITNLKSKSCRTPLNATNARSNAKHSKYDSLSRANNYEMIPFVMESYGGIGAEAVKLIQRLSKQSPTFTPKEFMRHAHTRLSITLQSANAVIAEHGIHQMLSDRLTRGGTTRSMHRSDIGMRYNLGPSASGMTWRRETHEKSHRVADAAAVTNMRRPMIHPDRAIHLGVNGGGGFDYSDRVDGARLGVGGA